jgi:hypothetical protein
MKRNIFMLLALLSAIPLVVDASDGGPKSQEGDSASTGLDSSGEETGGGSVKGGGQTPAHSGGSVPADSIESVIDPKAETEGGGSGDLERRLVEESGVIARSNTPPAVAPSSTPAAAEEGMWRRSKRKLYDAFDNVTGYYSAGRKGDFETEKMDDDDTPNNKHKFYNTKNAVRTRRAVDTAGMTLGLGSIAADAYNNVTWSYLQSRVPFFKRFSPKSKIARASVAAVEALILDLIMGGGIGTRGSLLGTAAQSTYNLAEQTIKKINGRGENTQKPKSPAPV